MSKKDYIAIANVIKDTNKYIKKNVSKDYQQAQLNAIRTLSFNLSNVFATDNPNFDNARFFEYIESEKRYKDFTDK